MVKSNTVVSSPGSVHCKFTQIMSTYDGLKQNEKEYGEV